ncbi:hypothetical protein CMV_029047 [Castanea mollissima]|uniref:Uncharacterized protein n=1 Tax=Castanea mollissima TaxID=60419 RepID=A0A8J4VBE5_9ROSI|nr:hypothetical protein CMV_029047 [Castanea mollissima]
MQLEISPRKKNKLSVHWTCQKNARERKGKERLTPPPSNPPLVEIQALATVGDSPIPSPHRFVYSKSLLCCSEFLHFPAREPHFPASVSDSGALVPHFLTKNLLGNSRFLSLQKGSTTPRLISLCGGN